MRDVPVPGTADLGIVVATEGDRKRVQWLIRRFGEDAVRQVVERARGNGEHLYPSTIARGLGLGVPPAAAGGMSKQRPAVAWRPFLSDSLRLGIRIRYAAQHNEWLKQALDDSALPRAWRPESKTWVIPQASLGRLLDALDEHRDVFPPDVARRFADAALRESAPFVAASLGVRLSRMPGGTGIVLESHFDGELVRVVRDTGAATWKSAGKAWVLDLSLSRVLDVLESAMIPRDTVSVSDDLLEEVDLSGGNARAGGIHVGPSAEPVPTVTGEPADAGKAVLLAVPPPMAQLPLPTEAIERAVVEHSLLDHQVEGVRHMLRYSSSLLADDMGMGKTRQAIVSCIIDGEATLVLCPATLKANWKDEIIGRGAPAESIQVLGGGAKPDPQKTWWIANYELADRLTALPFRNMVIDEAHYLKEPTALRTRNAFRLSAKTKRIMLLTATPILNREDEIWTLLRLGGHEIGRMELSEFRDLHAGSSEARLQLAARLSQWMLRRMKSAKVVPGKTRSEPRVAVDDDAMAEYRRIVGDGDMLALEKIGKLRLWLEGAKVPFVLDTLQGLQHEDKAIIFCLHLETVQRLMDELGPAAVRLTGQESMRARKGAETAFQSEPGVRFFVTTFKAGGVGLNLTAARYVLMASRPWTPAEMEQAEDRANRIGQKSVVQVIVPTVEGTIDEQIIGLLDVKQAITADILAARVV